MDGEEEGEKERDDFGFRDYFFFLLFPMTSAQLAGSGGVVREPTKNWSTAQICAKRQAVGDSVRLFIAAHLWLNREILHCSLSD